jgi:alpha-L-fucosidase
MKERFLAFDAIQHGKGFSFGDGKSNRYYLDGWKKKEQSVSWHFRTGSPGPLRFKMIIKYMATQETSGGSYAVIVNRDHASSSNELYNSRHGVSTDSKNVITQDLGDISLEHGSYTLKLVPVTINKDELMKLLEVQLIPLDK